MPSSLHKALLFLTVFCLSLPAAVAQAAPVTGKVAVGGDGVAHIRVVAYPATALSLAGDAPHVGQSTGEDGLFSLDLPPGSYYLLARGDGWFGYYGRNPVTVPTDGLAGVNLPLVPAASPPPELAASVEGGIVGRVVRDGAPMAGAVVFVYPDLAAQLKGFGLGMSAPSDAEGRFELPLPAGSYYLVARARHGSSLVGPLQAGDLFGYLPENPVVVRGGEVVRVSLPVIVVPEKVSRQADAMFGQTRISGTVVDQEGKPLAGLRALLYGDDAMLNRPLHVSAPTGADGVFHLSFPAGGTFYLAARSVLGGTPAPGELYGRYQGEGGTALKIETGKTVENLRIVVEPVW